MPNIKPISDLRNYSAVLEDVTVGSPVYLTKKWTWLLYYYGYKWTRRNVKKSEEVWQMVAELEVMKC